LSLDDIVGQRHILGEGKLLRKMIEYGRLGNTIFYGPSGTGKTTVAYIAAKISEKKFYKLNATNAGVSDIKNIISDIGGFSSQKGILLYLDEIQNFNKKQQQSLLEVIESGNITLIASTTENPYFYIYNAILSRSTVFEFKPIEADDILKAIYRAVEITQKDFQNVKIELHADAAKHIANMANGDVRRALNAVELCVYGTYSDKNEKIIIDLETAVQASQKKAITYDKLGDNHYDILSAFQKSIRGSDPDAATHYLARLVSADDLLSICRRLMVIACEDVGMAYPSAVSIVKSCIDCALQLGFPEARIPLSQAVILLATAPKSNSAILAIDAAISDIQTGKVGEILPHLRDSHYSGAKKMGRGIDYKFPHDFPNHYVKQQYLPDTLKDKQYYAPQNNKFEKSIERYRKGLIKDEL